MKTLLLGFLMMFGTTGFAGTQDCVECASRMATTPTVSMTHTNTNEMRHFTSEVGSRIVSPEIDHDLNADICDAFKMDGDFEFAMELIKEAGYKFEDIYNSINCGTTLWSPLHIVISTAGSSKQMKQKIWNHLDSVKSNNPEFKYEHLLNVPHGDPKGTLLDYIDRTLNLTSDPVSVKELKKMRLEVMERGGKRISEL